jgi:hypothetical protein
MLKIKYILPVFAMLFVLGLSNAAYAQLTCGVGSTPVSRDTDTGLTEPAGDLIFNCVQGAVATTTATMTIDFGVPISNSQTYPSATTGIRIKDPSGTLTGAQLPTVSGVNNATGTVVISIPAQAGGAGVGSFTLTGVLIALSGTGKTSVAANVSVSPGNNVLITAGQNVATVVTSVLPGLANPRLTTGTSPGTILTGGTVVAGGFSVAIPEAYIDLYRAQPDFNGGASTNGVSLVLTFAGIPTGVSISGCSASVTGAGAVSASATTLSSTSNSILLQITTTPSTTSVDTVTFACTTWGQGTATLPYTAGNVTVTATLAPTGTAFCAGAVCTGATNGQIPRYTDNRLPSPPLTVINIIPSTTNVLIPFVSIGAGFDTGFAFANTTNDPYGVANGGARSQSGNVTVYFFPVTGNPFCATTLGAATLPASGGTGAVNCTTLPLNIGQGDSTGNIAAGSSWIVLGSQIFSNITPPPPTFNGYAFAITNFTNAHVTAFVADATFSGKFSSGGPMLVLPNPAISGFARTLSTSTGVVETLSH